MIGDIWEECKNNTDKTIILWYIPSVIPHSKLTVYPHFYEVAEQLNKIVMLMDTDNVTAHYSKNWQFGNVGTSPFNA